MILGIGVDLANSDRIEKLYLKFTKKFPNKILSTTELKEYKNAKNSINFLTKKFCAKEAFSKALGTGIGRGINFIDITISNNILGKPIILLSEKGYLFVEKYFKKNKNNIYFDISISDEKPFVNAFVIISCDK